MEATKDLILGNLRKILQEKGVKVENISRGIGISKGEFSKILSGQRKDYAKHLHRMADYLNVSYHHLMNTPNTMDFKTANDLQTDLYERLINECKEKDKAKDDLIKNLYEQIENLKNKHAEVKKKLMQSKTKEKSTSNDPLPLYQ